METAKATAIEAAAAALRDGERSGEPCRPVRETLGSDTDVELAYAVQRLNVDRAVEAGRRISGRKIGLTAPAVQAQLGVDQPDYGVLFADTCLSDGADLQAEGLIQPRAEAEVAFVLGHDLDQTATTVVDVISATAYVLPAIEIVDSRIKGWDITIVDTIADNASCGRYVVGTRPVPLDAVDLRSLPMELRTNDAVASTGIGAACMGNPLNAVAWLADTMAAAGTPLRAGECIMSGALGPMVDIGPGDAVTVDLGLLGTVSTVFSEDTA